MMASLTYNEFTNTQEIDRLAEIDPMYRCEAHYPQRMSKLHLSPQSLVNAPTSGGSKRRRGGRFRDRNNARYRTQPITFGEIKEVDEDENQPTEEQVLNKTGFKEQCSHFSKTMEKIVSKKKSDDHTNNTNTDNSSTSVSHRRKTRTRSIDEEDEIE